MPRKRFTDALETLGFLASILILAGWWIATPAGMA